MSTLLIGLLLLIQMSLTRSIKEHKQSLFALTIEQVQQGYHANTLSQAFDTEDTMSKLPKASSHLKHHDLYIFNIGTSGLGIQ